MGRKRKSQLAHGPMDEASNAAEYDPGLVGDGGGGPAVATADEPPAEQAADTVPWDDPESNRVARPDDPNRPELTVDSLNKVLVDVIAGVPIDPTTLPEIKHNATVVDPESDPHGRIRGQIDAIANGAESTAGRTTESLRNALKSVQSAIETNESTLAKMWLREIQDQNQKVQIAFAELEAAKLVTKTKKATHDEIEAIERVGR